MMAHSPSHTHGTRNVEAAMIMRDAASFLKGLVPKYSDAPSATLIFHDAFERRATSPNTTAKPTPASGWRIIWVDDDLFIIQFLSLYLAESTKAWLDHLSRNAINCWDDLWEVFTDNLQGTYVHPGNP
jgi:hypothetical protein